MLTPREAIFLSEGWFLGKSFVTQTWCIQSPFCRCEDELKRKIWQVEEETPKYQVGAQRLLVAAFIFYLFIAGGSRAYFELRKKSPSRAGFRLPRGSSACVRYEVGLLAQRIVFTRLNQLHDFQIRTVFRHGETRQRKSCLDFGCRGRPIHGIRTHGMEWFVFILRKYLS